MTYILRPYQQEAVEAGLRFFAEEGKGHAIEVLPTGSGKSLVIASLVQRLQEPVLILQPSKEILEQNQQKLRSYGFYPNVFSASAGRKDVGEITLATIGSVMNARERFAEFRKLIIDECHLVNSKGGMYQEFITSLEQIQVLGLTATPFRLAANSYGACIRFLTRTRPRIFTDLIYHVQLRDLFAAGHLCKITYTSAQGFDRRQIKLNSTGADYDDASVKRYYNEIQFTDRIRNAVEVVRQRRKHVLVFTRFIEEAAKVQAQIPGAEIVTSLTSPFKRDKILEGFRTGEIPVVVNVGILTIGFDYPELDCIVMGRPTMSLGLYYQMIGRGMRPHPKKPELEVVDLCGNVASFGKIEDLEIRNQGGGKWVMASGEKVLTNVYFNGAIPFGSGEQKPAVRTWDVSRATAPKPCKSCGQPMRWLKTQAGKWMPLNPDGTSHWGTCRNAGQFKKGALHAQG